MSYSTAESRCQRLGISRLWTTPYPFWTLSTQLMQYLFVWGISLSCIFCGGFRRLGLIIADKAWLVHIAQFLLADEDRLDRLHASAFNSQQMQFVGSTPRVE